jgi:DNA-binding transcriptional LysR family regulator
MDLRTLSCFLAVAEEGSISAAAKRLHMSQPPLSVRIQALERELGVTLLARHGRGVQLTDAGRVLVERSRRLLLDVDGAADAVRSVGHGVTGRLSVAVGGTIAPSLVAALVRQMRADAPDVALAVNDVPEATVADHVRHGDHDTGLVYVPPVTTSPRADAVLDLAVVAREPLVAVLPRGHAQARGERADLPGLADETLIAPARPGLPGLHEHVVSAWAAVDGDPHRVREADSPTMILALVAAGVGVAVMPQALAALAWDEHVVLPVRQHRPAVETAVVWRRTATSPVLRRFLRVALSTPEPDVLGPDHARPDHETVGSPGG